MNAQADTTRGPGGMHVEESGTPGSPAIVFIHGAGQSSREWQEHMRRLSELHCLAPDLPGGSMASRSSCGSSAVGPRYRFSRALFTVSRHEPQRGVAQR